MEEERQMRSAGDLPELLVFDSEGTSVKANDGKGKEESVYLDRIFSGGSTQQSEVYEYVARPTIEDVIRGYNGTIFAYGQTGSGKTWSMFGNESSPELSGIIPRSCGHIFSYISGTHDGTVFTVKCSFLEIYKETIRDLLNPSGINLKVRETPSRGVWVEDLSEHYVQSEQQVLDLIKLGEQYRQVTATDMNQVSSRSHSLFIVILNQKLPDGSEKTGRLNLADLAGSEKVGKTNAVGNTLEEAKKINQSLSALGNCIAAITKGQKHVPYRDSKLSFVLRESLGGNTKTTLLVCCSPHRFNIDETVSTLRFAQRAKTIKNKATINQKRSVEELEAMVAKLTQEITQLKQYIALLERHLRTASPDTDLAALRQQAIKQPIAASSHRSALPPSASAPSLIRTPTSTSSSSSSSSSLSPSALLASSSSSSSLPSSASSKVEEELVGLQVRYDRLKGDLESQVQQLKEELEAATSERGTADSQMERYAAQVDEQQTRMSELEARAQAAAQERDQALAALDRAKRETQMIREASALLIARQQELEQSISTQSDAEELLTAAEQRCRSLAAEKQTLERDLGHSQSCLEAVRAEKHDLEQAVERYQLTEGSLLEARKSLVEVQGRFDELQSRHAKTESDLADSRQQHQDAVAKLRGAEAQLQAVSAEKSTAVQALQSKSDQLATANESIENLRQSNARQQAESQTYVEKSRQLEQQLQDSLVKLDALQLSHKEAKDKVKDIEKEMNRAATQHREVQRVSRNQISSLQSQREDLEQRLQAATKQKTEAEGQYKTAKQELESSLHNLNQLRLEHEQLGSAKESGDLQFAKDLTAKQLVLEGVEKRLAEAVATVADLTGRLDTNRSSLDQSVVERQTLTDRVAQLAATAQKDSEAHQLAAQQLKTELAKTEERVQQALNTVSALQRDQNALRSTIQEHEATIASLHAQQQKLQAEAEQAARQHQSIVAELNGEIERLKSLQTTQSATYASLKDAFAAKKKEYQALEKQLSDAQHEHELQSVGHTSALQQKEAELQHANALAERQTARIAEQQGQLSTASEQAQAQRDEAHGLQRQLERDLVHAQTSIKHLEQQAAASEGALAGRDAELQRAKAQLADKGGELAGVQERLQSAEAQQAETAGQLEAARARLQGASEEMQRAQLTWQHELDESKGRCERLQAELGCARDGMRERESAQQEASSQLGQAQQELAMLRAVRQSESQSRDAQVQQLSSIVEQQNEQLHELQASLADAQRTSLSQVQLLERARAQNEELAQSLEQRLAAAAEKVQGGEQERSALDRQLAEARQQLETARQQLAQGASSETALRESLGAVEQAMAAERERLVEVEQRRQELELQAEERQQEVAALQGELASRDEEHRQAEQRLRGQWQAEVAEREEAAALDAASHASAVQAKEGQVQQLSALVDGKNAAIGALQGQLAEVRQLQEEAQLAQREAGDRHASELTELQARLRDAEQQAAGTVGELRQQVAAVQAALDQARQEAVAEAGRLRAVADERQVELEASRAGADSERERLLGELEAVRSTLGSEQRQTDERLRALEADRASAGEELAASGRRCAEVEGQLEGARQQLASALDEVAELREGRQGAEALLGRAQEQLRSAQTTLDERQAELARAGEEARTAQTALEEMRAQQTSSEQQLLQDRRVLEEERDALAQALENAEDRISGLLAEQQSLESSADATAASLEQLGGERRALAQQLSQLQSEHAGCQGGAEQLRVDLESARRGLQEQQAQMAQRQAAAESEQRGLQERQSELAEQSQRLQAKLDGEAQRADGLAAEVVQLRTEGQKLTLDRDDLTGKCHRATERLASVTAQHAALEALVAEQSRTHAEAVAALEKQLRAAQNATNESRRMSIRPAESQAVWAQFELLSAVQHEAEEELRRDNARLRKEMEEMKRANEEEVQLLQNHVAHQAAIMQSMYQAKPPLPSATAPAIPVGRSFVEFFKQLKPSAPSNSRNTAIEDKRTTAGGTAILKEGYLWKEGSVVRSWKRRYFRLKPTALAYYRDSATGDVVGSYPITEGSTLGKAEVRTKKNFSFFVSNTNRCFFMHADNDEERTEWMEAIWQAILDLRQDKRGSISTMVSEFGIAPATSELDVRRTTRR